jgi:hypothetical protein
MGQLTRPGETLAALAAADAVDVIADAARVCQRCGPSPLVEATTLALLLMLATLS